MDAFGDNFVPGKGDENEVDPAADFLAREQNELAGLEVELKTPGSPITNGSVAEIPDPIGSCEIKPEDPLESNDTLLSAENKSPSPSSAMNHFKEVREEPEKIKKWREDQKQILEEKDVLEEQKKEEWRLAAKKELEEWYKHHEELITKTRASNRNAEKQFVAEGGEIEPGTEWERIAKLCDFNKKSTHISKDTTRMRSIILQLKQSPLSSKQA